MTLLRRAEMRLNDFVMRRPRLCGNIARAVLHATRIVGLGKIIQRALFTENLVPRNIPGLVPALSFSGGRIPGFVPSTAPSAWAQEAFIKHWEGSVPFGDRKAFLEGLDVNTRMMVDQLYSAGCRVVNGRIVKG